MSEPQHGDESPQRLSSSAGDENRPALLGGTPVFPEGPPGWPPDDPAIHAAVQQMLTDGSWGRYQAGHCERLIAALSEQHGGASVRLCCSGTAAVELALRGLQVGPGDEVLLAAYDFKGNFVNVLTLGALPVLVDIDPHSGQMDPAQLEAAFSEKTKAVIASHLHGGMVPMPAVMQWARSHELPVIEDACQMPGAVIHGRPAGTWGDVGVLSFGGSKLLSAGRGGALLSRGEDVLQRIRLYVQRGNEAYPLSEMQAAVLLPQLEQLPSRNEIRARHAALLRRLLDEVKGLRPLSSPAGKNETDSCRPGFYKFGLWYEPQAFSGLPRDVFAAALRAEGVALDAGFRALHRIHSRRRFRASGELPNAEKADEQMLVLHHPVLLQGEEALRRIVTAVEKIRCHAAELLSLHRERPTQ